MTRKTIIAIAALSFAFPGSMLAQKVGTSSLQFLKVMPTARATAMGDAYATLATGADAVFWNPAGLSTSNGIEATSTLTMWLFDTRQGAIAAAIPIEDWGTFGVQLQYVDFGTIEETRVDHLGFSGTGTSQKYNPGLTGAEFSPWSYLVGVTYARPMTDKFGIGVSVKFVQESLYGATTGSVVVPVSGGGTATETYKTYANSFLLDFGMLYNTGFRSIRIGVSVQNFGPQVKFAEETFPAPMALRFGTAADLYGPNGLIGADETNRLTAAYDIFQPNDYAQQMHFGLEYEFAELIAIRAGYKNNYDSERFTYGGGVRSAVEGYLFRLDYSYAGMGEYLGAAHRISFGVHF